MQRHKTRFKENKGIEWAELKHQYKSKTNSSFVSSLAAALESNSAKFSMKLPVHQDTSKRAQQVSYDVRGNPLTFPKYVVVKSTFKGKLVDIKFYLQKKSVEEFSHRFQYM